ncbi:MAG TPA: nucleotidyltransferase family protein [Smithellaceae bacterium]|nr:nucleotidyltransferase family protein [Smithellaceae bacterium]
MKAIILAGGLGSRLRDAVKDLPKPMAPVGGKPFLVYLLLHLKRWGTTDVVLSIGYKKDVIKSYFGDGSLFGIDISYSEENEPLGTGGALKQSLSKNDDSHFIVMNGDSFFNVPFADLIRFHAGNPGLITMGLAFVKDRSRYGGVEINDDDGRINSFQKDGLETAGLINSGVYIVDRNIAKYIPDGLVSFEENVLPLLKNDNLLYGKVFDAFFLDIGIPKDYLWINEHPEYLR